MAMRKGLDGGFLKSVAGAVGGWQFNEAMLRQTLPATQLSVVVSLNLPHSGTKDVKILDI